MAGATGVLHQLTDLPDAAAELPAWRSRNARIRVGGVVLRYGQFYGPGTFYSDRLPDRPRVHIDRAAERTVAALGDQESIVGITDDAPAQD